MPRPIPWPPPLDQRSSCHIPITLSPKTPTVGSTSAFRKLRPPLAAICGASCDAHAASGEARAEALTGVVTPATAAVDVTSGNALESAAIQIALFSNWQFPPNQDEPACLLKNLIPVDTFAQPRSCDASLRRLERADRRYSLRRRLQRTHDEISSEAADHGIDRLAGNASQVQAPKKVFARRSALHRDAGCHRDQVYPRRSDSRPRPVEHVHAIAGEQEIVGAD